MRIAAFVDDLWDRSRLESAIPGTTFVRAPEEAASFDTVVVDLARYGGQLTAIRSACPGTRVVAYGPHVILEDFPVDHATGADVCVPRSRFFRDPAFVIAND
ncbi:MAG: hypothetical protein ACOYN3_00780 [Acidimicrobiia bacterium]